MSGSETMRRLSLAAMLIAPALAGCTTNDPTFGGAARSNYAQQVINPDPRYDRTIVEGGDGTKSAAAVERYRTDKVKKPATISTTSGTSGSGGGSGGR
jgi:type IV pilus biogenesis protein CpaD/CtpE